MEAKVIYATPFYKRKWLASYVLFSPGMYKWYWWISLDHANKENTLEDKARERKLGPWTALCCGTIYRAWTTNLPMDYHAKEKQASSSLLPTA